MISSRGSLSAFFHNSPLAGIDVGLVRDKILPIDTSVMLAWGKLVVDLEKQGKPMPAVDSLLAAMALQGGLALVTRHEDDFAHCGVLVINPWQQ